ncbi:DNA polymerase/3'-5' exonuclease PolX [Alkalihalobacillus sp. 1P02AB]|uniref:DNA polymerase/3'-5' exonuclease PolX n=1 Tax=Alkalihalobacillus sp. 1P02AB TaxID=3132260 RepID=UPI0039A6F681
MMMNKKDVIKILEKIAIYLEIKGENPFKISAYRKAAQALETDERSLNEIDKPEELKGIGKGTAEVITELKETGISSLLEELMEAVPSGLIPLLKIQGLGGKKIGKLYQELGVVDVETLKKACEEKQVQKLAGFAKKTEEKILQAIQEASTRPERLAVPHVLPVAEKILKQLETFQYVERFSQAGSLRRLKETVKDLDFIIATSEPDKVREQLLQLENISKVIANGDTKVSIEVDGEYPISVDFRLVKNEEFPTTLHHFTGSKDHNVALRQLAKSRNEKISEYGVENTETGELKTFETEEAFFAHFDLPFIPPEARENHGEIEHFKENARFLQLKDIKADLHMHTTSSDGAHTLEEMVEAVRQKGYQYMAITDHSKFLRVANGLSVERLLKQHEEIRKLNEKYDDFEIFTGIEMDILPDGTLDYDDDILKNIDFVIASIHSSFQQSEETIMERLKNALYNPHVDMIAHPTGRVLGRRDGYQVDVLQLIELAKETNTALELNANPLRLDLASHWVRKAHELGVPIAINTDAHHIDMLDDMKYGVGVAVKGMANVDLIVNTWSVEKFKQFIKRND